MNGTLPPIPLAGAAEALAAGVALGLIHFHSLHWTARCFTDGRALRAFALQLVRIELLAGALYVAVQLGAGVLLAGALGVLAGRAIVLRRAGATE